MVGVKHDEEKPRIDLVPPGAILEVAEVLTSGVKEYGAHNWREGITYSRLYSAIQRHLLAFWKGEDVDKSGHRALTHACTDIMMLMEMPKEWDDRYIPHSGTLSVDAKPMEMPEGWGDKYIPHNGTFSVNTEPTGENSR